MIGDLFNGLVVQPIFNLLVFIYALLPGHNFGLAIIVFTIIVRILMWPIIRKQLRHTKAIRKLQPELKKIKQATKGNRQQESLMVMELYKERQISPFGSIGTLIIQLIILLGLYYGLKRVVDNPQAIIDNSYPFLHNLSWIKELGTDISKFDATLFGMADLTRAAVGKEGGVYIPAFLLVVGSAAIQYFQSMQLMPKDKDARSLRRILKEAGTGAQADQSEVNAAVNQNMRYIIPAMIFIFTLPLASALNLYWFVGGLIAYWQQDRILKEDEEDLEAVADKTTKKEIIEGEVIAPKTKTTKKKSSKGKRRKR